MSVEFERELTGYLRAGTLRNHETLVTGIEQAVPAFLGLFEGKNTGKMLVQLSAS